MKLSHAANYLALTSTVASINVVKIPVAGDAAGVVRRSHLHPSWSKRASVLETLIHNSTQSSYFATVSVGTPPQDMIMALDTGSSDAWAVSVDADLCSDKKKQYQYHRTCGATYDSSTSSTYTLLSPGFSIEYADGSDASGDWVTDDFTIGDITVSGLQMGNAHKTAWGQGVLGIGLQANEIAETQYPNLIATMVNQGKINTMAYSLYLNDYHSSTGDILFGGVDTEKFIGNLATLPILPGDGNVYSTFSVGVTGVSCAFANGTTYNQSLTTENDRMVTLLDSGTALSYFPPAIAQPILDAVGAYQNPAVSTLALVDCSIDVEFTFVFNNDVAITVPRDELVYVPSPPFGSACIFGIQSMDIGYAVLGDSFLRSAYVVYDLDNLQIGIAPANLNTAYTNVQELKAGEGSLAGFSGVASQGGRGPPTVSTSATSTASSSATPTASSSATPTASTSATSTASTSALSTLKTTGTGKTMITGTATGEGTLLSSTSYGRPVSTTSVDASAPYTSHILATVNTAPEVTSSSTLAASVAASGVVATTAYSPASASMSMSSTRVYGSPNATTHATTRTRRGSVTSAGMSSTVSVFYTDFSLASPTSTETSEGIRPGRPCLLIVVGTAVAAAMYVPLLFCL